MHRPGAHGSPSPTVAAGIVVGMLLMIAVPAAITLHSVHSPGNLELKDENPAPHGYTFSLLLFIIPIFAIAFWFLPSEGLDIPQRAFWRTIAILVPLGCSTSCLRSGFSVFPARERRLESRLGR